MLFNSLEFLIFFPSVVFLYFAVPHKYRWILLLGASYYFYMCWKAEYLLLILASTLIDYVAGIQMGKHDERAERVPFLIISLFTNLGLLFAFKYFNFFSSSLKAIFTQFNIFYNVPTFDVLLPVGISFYTFQTLSYSIDVYRGERKPEKHLGVFALYVAFFPQLVAGPIERSTSLLPQFFKKNEFDYQRVTDGLKLMILGFFKKLVVADNVAVFVDQVYNHPTYNTGLPLIIATYFFAFQIYCDFSGYSDIAIGAAKVMGYDLMANFKRPYFSKSISEFWKRWHISLSTWFRDYLYIPLGGNRVVKWRWYYNLMVVFLVSGMWHGANWTFLTWGGLHGFYLVFSIWTKTLREKLSQLFRMNNFPIINKFVKVGVTFHLVIFAWIFFRANSLSDAFYIIINLFNKVQFTYASIEKVMLVPEFLKCLFAILLLISIHLFQRNGSINGWLTEKPIWFRWSVYYIAIIFILLLGNFDSPEFIYFQF